MKLRAAVCFVLSLLAAAPVAAAIVSQSRTWSAGFGTPDVIAFDPFDAGLGTLTRVEVVLSGVMTLQAFAAPFSDGQGGFFPYSFTVLSKLDSISPGGTGFEFGSAAQWLANFTVPGTGSNVVAASAFELTFEFGDASELLGFAIPDGISGFTQPPTTINARRSDFIEDLVNQLLGIQQQFFVPELPQVSGAPVPVTITSIDFSGLMRLDYLYEPRLDVPEPASLALIGIALALLPARRLRGASR